MWRKRLNAIKPVEGLGILPDYSFLFFFRNMEGFRLSFWSLTLTAVMSAVLRFYMVALLADLISHARDLDMERVLKWYLPAFLLAAIVKECVDFFLRWRGEPFPTIYREHVQLRFISTLFNLRSHRLFNTGKERLQALQDKYVAHIERFLTDWFWGTTRRATQLVIVLGILWQQSLAALAFNVAYIAMFLALSFRLSRGISSFVRPYSEAAVASRALVSQSFIHLNAIKRFRAQDYLLRILAGATAESWGRLAWVNAYHARRWLLQLLLFNLLYIGTLVSGVLQVINGTLEIGFLILIKYAFDNLWEILTYSIEYYVSLITQKQDANLFRAELQDILHEKDMAQERYILGNWQQITLTNAVTEFRKESSGESIRVMVPALTLSRGGRVGIIGESGAGKSTLLNMLLGLAPFTGELAVDQRPVRGLVPDSRDIVLVSATDPFFAIPLVDNLLLGADADDTRIRVVLSGLRIDRFVADLQVRFGDPGVHFSAGQEQRLRLARGLLQDGKVYLLDEPFNGIDPDTKSEIIVFLKDYLCDKTLVLVTHNASELELVDEVYEFSDGILRHRSA